MVVKALAVHHADSCRGTHTNMHLVTPTFGRNPLIMLRTILGFIRLPGGYPAHEIQALKDAQESFEERIGYVRIQSIQSTMSQVCFISSH